MSKLDPNRAFLVLEREFKLPDDCPAVNVSIGIYPKNSIYYQNIKPVLQFSPNAVLESPNKVSLSERVICFDLRDRLKSEPIIEIQVDGETIFQGWCDEAIKHGVQQDGCYTYFLDYINLS